MEYIQFPKRSEAEMREQADALAQTMVVREYDDGSSKDTRRETTQEEQAALSDIFYSAMMTLDWHAKDLTRESIQAIKDMAEFNCHLAIPYANGYDTVYNPLGKYIESSILVAELASDIEQFMFERGEYQYGDGDLIRWIADANKDRAGTEKLITQALRGVAPEEIGSTEPLQSYLNDQIHEMDEEDELIEVAENLIRRIDKLEIVSPEKESASEKPQKKRDDMER